MIPIIEIARSAAVRIGSEPPRTLVGYDQGDTTNVKLLEALRQTCRYLVRQYDWQASRREHRWISVEGAIQPYAIPADVLRILQDTLVCENTSVKFHGPVEAHEWAERGWTYSDCWRIDGDRLLLSSALPHGTRLSYRYVANTLCVGPTGERKRDFSADLDVPLWDDELVRLGTVYHYRKNDGGDYGPSEYDFKSAMQQAIARDGGRRTLDLGSRPLDMLGSVRAAPIVVSGSTEYDPHWRDRSRHAAHCNPAPPHHHHHPVYVAAPRQNLDAQITSAVRRVVSEMPLPPQPDLSRLATRADLIELRREHEAHVDQVANVAPPRRGDIHVYNGGGHNHDCWHPLQGPLYKGDCEMGDVVLHIPPERGVVHTELAEPHLNALAGDLWTDPADGHPHILVAGLGWVDLAAAPMPQPYIPRGVIHTTGSDPHVTPEPGDAWTDRGDDHDHLLIVGLGWWDLGCTRMETVTPAPVAREPRHTYDADPHKQPLSGCVWTDPRDSHTHLFIISLGWHDLSPADGATIVGPRTVPMRTVSNNPQLGGEPDIRPYIEGDEWLHRDTGDLYHRIDSDWQTESPAPTGG